MSCVPLGVERVACMTAAYLKTSSRTLPDGVILVIALTLCQFGTGICDGILVLCPSMYLLYKGRIIQKSVDPVNWESIMSPS